MDFIVSISFFKFYFLSLPEDTLICFYREWGEGEKETSMWESLIGCLCTHPDWGSVPGLGIMHIQSWGPCVCCTRTRDEPATLGMCPDRPSNPSLSITGWCSNRWAAWARACSYHFWSSELIVKNTNQWLSENPVTQFLISVLKTTSLLEETEKNIGCKWGKDIDLLTSWALSSFFPQLFYLHSFYFRWKLLNSFLLSGKYSFHFIHSVGQK